MLGAIRHRGPDAFGVYLDDRIGLGSARLSIVDLPGGNQPVHNEDETVWIVYNGEVYNYPALRAWLIGRGHRFYTHSDTEVIVHLYEERGVECVESLNGQFAFALWNSRSGELVLARDRLGVRPLFYARTDGVLTFASEIKAIFAGSQASRSLDLRTLDQVFTYWAPLPGGTAFASVREVPAGHILTVREGEPRVRPYWAPSFPTLGNPSGGDDHYVDALRSLLADATRLRLRADVPVGAYLSGGLDSSAIAALARTVVPGQLRTFSVAFEEAAYDESAFQAQMARHLGVEHQTLMCTDADIARVFPEVIRHCETPILRTAPAPLFLLSKLVRESGLKVVLTGEGADELLAGYNIFKEDRIRRFWARNPASRMRPLLLRRLYPYVRGLQAETQTCLESFFGTGLTNTDVKGYSHALRWRNTARLKRLFAPEVRCALAGYDRDAELDAALDDRMRAWHPLSQAQYVETTLFLSQYLLSSQGDRMAMAHSVEGRFPFLDPRLVEFCNHVPPDLKLRGLDEKHLLKQAVKDFIPESIRRRPKQPYRAPTLAAFFGPEAPDYVADLLAPTAIRKAGYFNAGTVGLLVDKARRSSTFSEMDSMALVGVLSVQLLHSQFADHDATRTSAHLPELTLVFDRSTTAILDRAR